MPLSNEFKVTDLIETEMESIERCLATANLEMIQLADNLSVPTGMKTAMSSLYIAQLRQYAIAYTLASELDRLRRPWYKKLFRIK